MLKTKVSKMREPMTSILWLNYNSSSFIDVALESLQGIMDLDYSNYELIVVDNCSTDRSFNVIKSFIENKMSNIRVKVIRLDKNLGFTGGNNVAYRARNQESKYIVFLNNDAIPYSTSLTELIEFMENNNTLGAAQGIILRYDGRTIQSTGNYLSELFTTHSLYCGEPPLKKSKNPRYITFASGCYSVHRVSSIKTAVDRNDSIFDEFMFAYYDDWVLGLKMWNAAFEVAAFPIMAARHKESSSFTRVRSFQVYLETRGVFTLNEISNNRYKKLIKTLLIDKAYAYSTQKILSCIIKSNIEPSMGSLSAALLKGFVDGVRIGKMKRGLGETINMYKAPIITLNLSNFAIIGTMPWVRLSGRVIRKLNQIVLHDL
jgi:GT2 family glycosyltransferase